MELLDVLTVYCGSEARTVELWRGDMTNLTPAEAVDVLIVSAFPNNYLPISGTSIGSLYRRGITVEDLAKTKAIDLRHAYSCWVSEELVTPPPGIEFKRILCFEPPMFGSVNEVVGDMFRCLAATLEGSTPVSAMLPLIAVGNQGETATEVLAALLDAATHWMTLGLPLKQLKLVEQSAAKAVELRRTFERLRPSYPTSFSATIADPQYDVLLSYAPKDSAAQAEIIATELRAQQPHLRVSLDRPTFNTARVWQPLLYETLDQARSVIILFSPAYVKSKMCQEEFNLALYRHGNAGTLVPILVHTTQLPPYMRRLPYLDCREGDVAGLRAASAELLARLDW